MGEIADIMLDGTLCEACGEYLGDTNGFATYCKGCAPEVKDYSCKPKQERVSCTVCKKRVKKVGLWQHMKDVHPKAEVVI